MLAAATEYSGPCMCPMWPFQHWRCLKHKECVWGGEGSRDASAAREAWKSGGFPHGSVPKKSLPFPTPLASSLSLPPSFLAPRSIATSAFFLPFHTPALHSPPLAPRVVSAALILAAALQKSVEGLRQWSSRLLVTRALALQASGLMLAV